MAGVHKAFGAVDRGLRRLHLMPHIGIYDEHPPYPHQTHLRFAYEPFKSMYVFQRLITTLFMVIVWVLYYGSLPDSFRPRKSWKLKQIVVVNFYRRIYKVTEVAGVTWGTRNPEAECDNRTLKETRFEWIPPVPTELRTGILVDDSVPFKRVGTFVWPHDALHIIGDEQGAKQETENETPTHGNANSTKGEDGKPGVGQVDPEPDVGIPKVIGVFMHGGGYTQMSAHEKAGTSRIPRRLIKDGIFTEIYGVEYRLLQHAPCPAALQDAAAVYSHLIRFHPALSAQKGEDGVWRYPNSHAQRALSHEDVVLRGTTNSPSANVTPESSPDSTPESAAQVPSAYAGPSKAEDFASAHPHVQRTTAAGEPVTDESDIADGQSPPNAVQAAHTNSLNAAGGKAARDASTPVPGRTTKIVLIGDSAGGNLVLGLARWIRDEGVLPMPDGLLMLSPSCDPSHAFPLTPSSYIPRPHAETDYLVDNPEPRALLQKTFLGHHPLETIHSPYLSPASPRVLRAYGHPVTHAGTDVDQHVPDDHYDPHASHAPRSGTQLDLATDDNTRNGNNSNTPGDTTSTHNATTTPNNDTHMTLGPIPGPDTIVRTIATGTDRTLHQDGAHVGAGAIAQASASVLAIAEPIFKPKTDAEVRTEMKASQVPKVGRTTTELELSVQSPRPVLQSTQTFLNPRPKDPALRSSLFGGFSRSFVTVGDAERLEREIVILVNAMERDGVDVRVQWAKDGVHDLLMLPWWDNKVLEETWKAIGEWVGGL